MPVNVSRLSAIGMLVCAAVGLGALWATLPSPRAQPLHVDTEGIQRHEDSGAADTLGCETLSLTPKDVATYFSTATEVSAATFHAESIILPCSFSGTLMKGGAKYAWRVHAAGAGYLTAEATGQTQRFLCQAACEKALPALMGQ
ncbi:hypothetical protein AVAK2825_05715 [Acidovorax sp. SUPP2825]|nr:hypothetical protein AVAK2825_05715 [Acidovorax sp. SUPP2825]